MEGYRVLDAELVGELLEILSRCSVASDLQMCRGDRCEHVHPGTEKVVDALLLWVQTAHDPHGLSLLLDRTRRATIPNDVGDDDRVAPLRAEGRAHITSLRLRQGYDDRHLLDTAEGLRVVGAQRCAQRERVQEQVHVWKEEPAG